MARTRVPQSSQCGSRGKALLRLCLCLSLALPAAAQDVTSRASPASRMEASRFVEIARETIRELHETLGLPARHAKAEPIQLEVGYPHPFAFAVGHRLVRGPSGKVRAIVQVPDPGNAPEDEVRYAVAAAELRTLLYARAPVRATVAEPPPWLVRGLALESDADARGANFESAWTLWSSSRLPGAALLFADDSPASLWPAVSAEIAAFLGSTVPLGGGWEAMLHRLAARQPWTAEAVAQAWLGDGAGVAELDAAWCSWMVARSSHVFSAGRTPPGAVERFRLELVSWPWRTRGWSALPAKGVPLADLDPERETEEIRRMAGRFRLVGAGHDPLFSKMCAAHADALASMLPQQKGRKVKPVDSAPLWKEAGRLLREVEIRAATGAETDE